MIQSPFPKGLGIGMTYPQLLPQGKWYDPNVGLPHPKSTSENGNSSPDETTKAGPSPSLVQ